MNYEIVELKDISIDAKRISAKVITDIDRNDKEKIKQLVLHLIEEVRMKRIENKRTLEKHGSKPFEVVYIYLYKNKDELNHGLPLARASFIDPNCKVKPLHFSNEFINENTTIKFDGFYNEISKIVEENKVSDAEFDNNAKERFSAMKNIYEALVYYRFDYGLLSKEYEKHAHQLNEFQKNFIGFPSDNKMDVYRSLQQLLNSLVNIGIVVNNTEYNINQKEELLKLYFADAAKSLDHLLSKYA